MNYLDAIGALTLSDNFDEELFRPGELKYLACNIWFSITISTKAWKEAATRPGGLELRERLQAELEKALPSGLKTLSLEWL